MNSIEIPSGIIGIFVTLLIGLSMVLGWAVIPTESTEENRPLLWGIMGVNLFFAIALFLFVYYFNTVIYGNILQISMVFTFLVALPITLYNIGVTSILFSN